MVDVGAAPIDRYVVLEHLSEGGMGAIYVGKKLGAGGFEMQVVLKQLLPEFTQQEEFIDLFLREAKLSATLDHANIVHTIDLVTAGNEYFIVMEYLAGGDLRTLLKKAKRRGKRFSPAAAIHICREVLSALAYAHAKRDFGGNPLKLIHRDVSPSNILVSHAGEVKLTDFGIAKAATHNSLFYKVKGKIGYMSPEQARSEALDHRSDLYSLAVCMYEVLTGERLFVHAGLTTSAEEIYSQPVPLVSRKVPGLTTDLDAIMHKALALSPDARYQTAGEFQEALTRCAHRNGLLISAPEVARELLDLCGPFEQWRGEDDDDDLGYVRRAGTEVYDGGEEEEEEEEEGDDDEDLDAGVSMPPVQRPSSRLSSPALRASSSRISRPPLTELSRLQGGVELTSIINMIDLEHQHREAMGEARTDLAPRRPEPRPAVTAPGYPRGPVGPPGPPSVQDPRELMPTQPRQLPGMSQTMPAPSPVLPGRSQTMPAPSPMLPGPPPGNAGPHVMAAGLQPMPGAPPAMVGPPRPFAGEQSTMLGPHIEALARSRSRVKRRSVFRPWMVIVAIVLAAATAGVVVAISGPNVAVQRGK